MQGANSTLPVVKFVANSVIKANFYAPNGKLQAFPNVNLSGQFIAKSIQTMPGVTMFLQPTCWPRINNSSPRMGSDNNSSNEDGKILKEGNESEFLRNHPNPFSNSTTIEFMLSESGRAKLDVYNYMGVRVTTLFDGSAEKQKLYSFLLDAKNLSVGIYLCNLQTDKERKIQKMMIVK